MTRESEGSKWLKFLVDSEDKNDKLKRYEFQQQLELKRKELEIEELKAKLSQGGVHDFSCMQKP